MHLNYKKFNIARIIIYFFPVFLITGPAIPDISLFFVSIIFFYSIFRYKRYDLLNENWFKIGIILWIWFLIISFFAYNKYLSFIDATIFVRFLIYILVIQNLVIVNNNIRENIIKIIFISLIFITFDCFFQFFNYKPEIGFYKDLLGRVPGDLYARLSGPFKDLVPGSVITKFFFISLLFVLFQDIKFINGANKKKLLIIFILSASIAVVYFSGERIAFLTLLLGIFISLILIKKIRTLLLLSSFVAAILIISFQNIHPIYKNNQIIQSTSKHEGLIIEKKITCKNTNEINCTKQFVVQPEFFAILKDFKSSAYGETYLTAYKIWQDYKFFGIGLNNFKYVCDKENKYDKFHKFVPCASHPHNFYIQALVETGVIGLILFISFIISIILTILKSNQYKVYKIVFLISIIVIFWPIMSTGSFLKNWHMCIICFILGICVSDINRKKLKNISFI